MSIPNIVKVLIILTVALLLGGCVPLLGGQQAGALFVTILAAVGVGVHWRRDKHEQRVCNKADQLDTFVTQCRSKKK